MKEKVKQAGRAILIAYEEKPQKVSNIQYSGQFRC